MSKGRKVHDGMLRVGRKGTKGGVSAAQTAQNPTFMVHGVSTVTVPPSFRKDGARKRFSPSLSVPPPSGGRQVPGIVVRRKV